MDMEDIAAPRPQADEVSVRIHATGICGSDIHGFSGKTGRRMPGMVMGHEIAGEVAESGEKVRHVTLGQRVVVQPIISCKTCQVCREGKTSICLNKKMVGVNMGTTGGLSEFIAVPGSNVFPIPDDMDYAIGTLAEPFAVGVSAVKAATINQHNNVLIVGAGLIGQTILLMALEQTPGKIFIVDNNERKLATAEKSGAIPINFSRQDPVSVILNITKGTGVDVAIEAVGVAASVKTAMAATRPGGQVVWVGNSQKLVEIDMQDVVVKAKQIQGVYCYTDMDFKKATDYIVRHRSEVELFIEKKASFLQATDLYTRLAKNELELFRGVVCF